MKDSIYLVPYNPEWPKMFEAESAVLKKNYSSELIEVEHIGSTAVVGLIAKPIIDILGGVLSMEVADSLLDKLIQDGWDTSAEFNSTIGNRRFLLKWPNGVRTHHLHLVEFDGHDWRNSIAFRNGLRGDSAVCRKYEKFKTDLAQQFENDREKYTEYKEDFIHEVLKEESLDCLCK